MRNCVGMRVKRELQKKSTSWSKVFAQWRIHVLIPLISSQRLKGSRRRAMVFLSTSILGWPQAKSASVRGKMRETIKTKERSGRGGDKLCILTLQVQNGIVDGIFVPDERRLVRQRGEVPILHAIKGTIRREAHRTGTGNVNLTSIELITRKTVTCTRLRSRSVGMGSPFSSGIEKERLLEGLPTIHSMLTRRNGDTE